MRSRKGACARSRWGCRSWRRCIVNWPMSKSALQILADEVVACTACPRLTAYRRKMAEVKRRAYRDWEYWGRPVPPFGDAAARMLIVGLAPAAHGGNRTGRMFTGDR